MPLTRDFRVTVKERAERDVEFREGLLKEALQALTGGEFDLSKILLRDYINATEGFESVANAIGMQSKSVMRMLSPQGNPNARNLMAIIAHLRKKTKADFFVKRGSKSKTIRAASNGLVESRRGAPVSGLTKIEGIGEKYAKPLRAEGINSIKALLEAGKTREGRGHLAKVTKLSEKHILSWVNKADLFRVPGIGEEFSDLLEAAGVNTVKELKARKPESLQVKIAETNAKKKLTRRTPGLKAVEKWVAGAKALPAVVKY